MPTAAAILSTAIIALRRLPVVVLALLCFVLGIGQASAVEFSTVEVAGKRVTICRVNVRKERLRLFHRDEAGLPFKRFGPLSEWLKTRGQKLVFAMNAGMFHPDRSAVGLSVIDGKELTPLNTANAPGNFFLKPNGVFLLTDTGARVVETSEYPGIKEPVLLATQSGPLLLRQGRIHPVFKPDSTNRLYRNGVGVLSPDVVIFAISEASVSLYEFASMFRDQLHCKDALFLDGDISSLYSTELKRSDFRMDLGPIIGVTE